MARGCAGLAQPLTPAHLGAPPGRPPTGLGLVIQNHTSWDLTQLKAELQPVVHGSDLACNSLVCHEQGFEKYF